MKKAMAVVVAALLLVAATPDEVVTSLESNGYYIENGSNATEQVVSDAVFEGRAAGGRVYIVVLAEEPPGGATTFSDSVLDRLDGEGYVVTVAPATVGFAGDGTLWSAEEMNAAVDASVGGGSDDEVIELFVAQLTGEEIPGGAVEPDVTGSSGWVWILLLGGGGLVLWLVFRSRSSRRSGERLARVKEMARVKLDEVANDILEMEDEVAVSDNAEVKAHYQRASAAYSKAIEETERATSVPEMLKVTEGLDLAIWELDCAEALLDGKAKPPKPEPPKPELVVAAPPETSEGERRAPPTTPQYDRRPERHSSGTDDMLSMLVTMIAMGGLRGRGGFGGMGNWTRSSGGAPRLPMGGFGGRIRGGGRRHS